MSNPQADHVSSEREDLIAEIIDRYISGQSIRMVASAIQRSYGLVQGVLKQAGVALRAPGGSRAPSVTEEETAERGAAMAVHPSAGLSPDEGEKKASGAKVKNKKKRREKGRVKAMVSDMVDKKAEAPKCESKSKSKSKCECSCGCKDCTCGTGKGKCKCGCKDCCCKGKGKGKCKDKPKDECKDKPKDECKDKPKDEC